jgi:hypothetical protein
MESRGESDEKSMDFGSETNKRLTAPRFSLSKSPHRDEMTL